MLNVIERIVDKESQFWDDAHLISYACAQFVTYLLGVGIDIGKDLFAFLAGEHTQLGCADTQVWRYLGTCNRYHHTVSGTRLLLEYEREFLLQQSRNFVLSRFLHKLLFLSY